MSQENVEIVKAVFETWNAGEMDAFRELYDPDVIVRTAEGWPEPGPYVGREAAMRFFTEQLGDAWDANTLVPINDFIDAGDRVAVRYIWRGAGHGPDLNMEVTLVFTMRKGRIFYQEFFWDHAEALEAAGLSEQDAHADS
jgi:ketosteroid isomerase-like protein